MERLKKETLPPPLLEWLLQGEPRKKILKLKHFLGGLHKILNALNQEVRDMENNLPLNFSGYLTELKKLPLGEARAWIHQSISQIPLLRDWVQYSGHKQKAENNK